MNLGAAAHAQDGVAQLRAMLSRVQGRLQQFKLREYRPYAKQREFHAAGAVATERLFRAGNQLGKTFGGAAEMAMHLTGQYPPWWCGRRFDAPIEGWASCETGEATRDNPQKMLMGTPGSWGTGSIPGDCVIDKRPGRGVADLLDTVLVKHVSGGTSRLGFKHYGQGREAWQGPSKHVIWCDEEPPLDIYGEALARLTATRGIIYTTFTPLKGMSEVVERLMTPGDPDRVDINMTIDDAEHIPVEERARIVARYPAHEREARARGVPVLGSGRVFPVTEESIRCDPFPLAGANLAYIGAMDFGWDHPFAAVKIAWNRDTDCAYVVAGYREREQTPVMHAAALKPWGAIHVRRPGMSHEAQWLKWAWPHDGLQHDKGSGDALSAQYRAQGLKMLPEHATHPEGGYGLEAGIIEMLVRMQTGRLKVFSTLGDWFEEFRLYHRKDGLIVKKRDDLLSATRIGIMMLRAATPVPSMLPGGGRPTQARGMEDRGY